QRVVLVLRARNVAQREGAGDLQQSMTIRSLALEQLQVEVGHTAGVSQELLRRDDLCAGRVRRRGTRRERRHVPLDGFREDESASLAQLEHSPGPDRLGYL